MEKYRLLRERVTEYAEVVLEVPEAATTGGDGQDGRNQPSNTG